jgi:O-Antigen ligase
VLAFRIPYDPSTPTSGNGTNGHGPRPPLRHGAGDGFAPPPGAGADAEHAESDGDAPLSRAERRAERRASWALYLAMAGIVLMGFNRIRVAGWTPSDACFIASAAVIIADLLSGRTAGLAPKRSRRSSPQILVATIVLLTAGTLSAFQAFDPAESMMVVLRLGWILLGLFWVLRSVAPDRERLTKLLTSWRWMIMLNAAIAVSGQLGLTHFSATNAENRQSGFYDQPNEFAGLLVIGVPLFLMGVPHTKEYKTDGQELFARAWRTGFVVYAVATTGSMTNILAATVGVLVVLATGGWRHLRRPGHSWSSPLLPMTVLIVAALGLVALANSDLPVVERFTRYTSGDQYVTGSVSERGSLNAQVTENFDELLVVGRGFSSVTFDDRARDDTKDNLATHNMYLLLLLQAGLPALVALVLILGFTANHGLKLVNHTRGSPLHPIAIALLASFASANTFALFQPTQYQRYFWLPAAFIAVLWAICREEARVRLGEVEALPPRPDPGDQTTRVAQGAG